VYEITATKGENKQLVSEVQRLKKREGQLVDEKIKTEFDITHYRALVAILEGRIGDLERVIAAHDDLVSVLEALCVPYGILGKVG
jgi:hypothetical protein